MKKKFRKMTAVLLAVVMIAIMIPIATVTISAYSIPDESGFISKINYLKQAYPSGGTWSNTYYENGVARAWQCHGYACQMMYEVFGAQYYSDGLSSQVNYTMGTVNAGDLVRINGDSHSIFITKVTSDRVYFTDANWDYNNGIRWDASYTVSELRSKFTYKVHIPGSTLTGTGSVAYNPQGVLDLASGGEGTVTLSGWAFDRDDLNSALEIHVYIGGRSGDSNAEGHGGIIANAGRGDVNAVYGCGDYHGFSATISTNKRGSQPVYVYALNIGSGENVQIGEGTVFIDDDNCVKNAWIQESSDIIAKGDSITFTFGADNANRFDILINRDGERYIYEDNITSGITYEFNQEGNYNVYICGHNGNKYMDSETLYFEVVDNTENAITLAESTPLNEQDMINLGTDFDAKIRNVSLGGLVTNTGIIADYQSISGHYCNVVLRSDENTDKQSWRFTRNDDGTYSISSNYNNMMLQDFDKNGEAFSNIVANLSYNISAQKWALAKGKAGAIYLYPKTAVNCCLDVADESNNGERNIRLNTYNGSFNQRFVVEITSMDPTDIQIDHDSIVLTKGQTYRLNAIIQPQGANSDDLGWWSSNISVCDVDDGLVTAIGVGETVITVETDNGLSATCSVIVKQVDENRVPVSVEPLSIPQIIFGNEIDPEIDLNGMTANIIYDDETTELVEFKNGRIYNDRVSYEINGFSYHGYVYNMLDLRPIVFWLEDVNVDVYNAKNSIERISVKKLPEKTEYYLDEAIGNTIYTRSDGLVLKITAKDGTSNSYGIDEFRSHTVDLSNIDGTKTGKSKVIVTYGDLTTSFYVNVLEEEPVSNGVADIIIDKLPDKEFIKKLDLSWFTVSENGERYYDPQKSNLDFFDACENYLINKNMIGTKITVLFKDGTMQKFDFEMNCSLVGSDGRGVYIFGEDDDEIMVIIDDIGEYQATMTINDYSRTFTANHKELTVGDTNLDGNIDIRDVTAIQRHLAKLETFTDEQLALADTNGDGEINIMDATQIQKYIAKHDGIVLG